MRAIVALLTLAGFLVANVSARADLDTGLLAYYPFNGNANDATGNGNDGTVHDAALDVDRFGTPDSAYHFNGSTSYIQLITETLEVHLADYSITAWINTSPPTNNGRVFSKGSSSCVTGYMMRMNGNHLWLENAQQGFCYVSLESTRVVADGHWHFVAGVVNRHVGASIYIDGQLDASQAIDTSSYDLANGRGPVIGTNDVEPSRYPEYFSGDIDDVRIYNRVLSESEVQQIYLLRPRAIVPERTRSPRAVTRRN